MGVATNFEVAEEVDTKAMLEGAEVLCEAMGIGSVVSKVGVW